MSRIGIALASAARIDGRLRFAGEAVVVTADIADQLEAAGAVVPGSRTVDPEPVGVTGSAPTREEVNAALARAIEAEAQRDLLQERVLVLQAELDEAVIRLAESEAQIAANAAPPAGPQDTTPSDAAATAPKKKGTAATKG